MLLNDAATYLAGPAHGSASSGVAVSFSSRAMAAVNAIPPEPGQSHGASGSHGIELSPRTAGDQPHSFSGSATSLMPSGSSFQFSTTSASTASFSSSPYQVHRSTPSGSSFFRGASPGPSFFGRLFGSH